MWRKKAGNRELSGHRSIADAIPEDRPVYRRLSDLRFPPVEVVLHQFFQNNAANRNDLVEVSPNCSPANRKSRCLSRVETNKYRFQEYLFSWARNFSFVVFASPLPVQMEAGVQCQFMKSVP